MKTFAELKQEQQQTQITQPSNPVPVPVHKRTEDTPKYIRRFTHCPRCHSALGPTESFNGGPSLFWLECVRCNTFVNTYMPLAHQSAVHRDAHTIVGNFGGYGTGKSLTSIEDTLKHILITPSGHTMVTAQITYQYEQTFKKEFEKDIPKAFVADYSAKYATMELINGHTLSYRPLDDPNKLRSNNLTRAVIIEGSETPAEGFHQLKTRLRNTSACTFKKDEKGNTLYRTDKEGRQVPIIDKDWRQLIVESNPDAGWIKQDLLNVSEVIHKHGIILDEYEQITEEIDPLISSHVSSTHVNTFLPQNYIEMISRNKPEWWINRYIRSSFTYAEGLVYPNARKCLQPSFKLPADWKRIAAFDYGLSDNAVFLFGAIDMTAGILYIYKEVVMNNSNIEELAAAFKEASIDIPIGGWYSTPLIDPKSNKRDFNKKDLINHFLDYGVAFKPGHVNLDARIMRLNTYIETDRIRIFSDTCPYLVGEILDYKFEERNLDNKKRQVKPVDKNNHAVNPLEWITMELPTDPKNLGNPAYNSRGELIQDNKEMDKTPWQLADEEEMEELDIWNML